jgi:hypothetical protein
MYPLAETHILRARFLVLYGADHQVPIPLSIPQDQNIREVIVCRLVNPPHALHVSPFVQGLFHIIPLKLMILAWRNADRTVSKVHLLFASMSQHRVTDAISLSTMYM